MTVEHALGDSHRQPRLPRADLEDLHAEALARLVVRPHGIGAEAGDLRCITRHASGLPPGVFRRALLQKSVDAFACVRRCAGQPLQVALEVELLGERVGRRDRKRLLGERQPIGCRGGELAGHRCDLRLELVVVDVVAADVYRPAAINQLQTLGKQINIPVYEEGTGKNPVDIATQCASAMPSNAATTR